MTIEIINSSCEQKFIAHHDTIWEKYFLEIKDPDIFSFECGTVPHYMTFIEKDSLNFLAYQDEYFYDSGNRIPKELFATIPLDDVKNVFFTNGKTAYLFDANYYHHGYKPIDPLTLIVETTKGFTIHNDNTYGLFQEYLLNNNQLIITKNGLKGIYGHTECIYKEISSFHGSLAKFTDIDDRAGFITTEGKVIYCE